MEEIINYGVKNYKAGFYKGWQQLRLIDVEPAKKELLAVIGLHGDSRMSWQNYRKGKSELSATKAALIEQIFLKYGVTDVWGGKSNG